MSDMVERVAMAISSHIRMFDGEYEVEAAARAAISAMREPTQQMAAVAELDDYTEGNGLTDKVTADTARDLWRDMIDAALGKG